MGKKSRKYGRLKDDAYEEFDDLFDDDFDWKQVIVDRSSNEWPDDFDTGERSAANVRRKIERRRDRQRLYSQLDDWEEFGQRGHWH